MKLIGGYHSDKGRYRENNEDVVYLQISQDHGFTMALGAVCDGIGGLEHGEFASGSIIADMKEWTEGVLGWLDADLAAADILFPHLKDAAEFWNASLYQKMADLDMHAGTTMSCLLLVGTSYGIVHVGDSRIYRYRPKKGLEPLTSDESVARLQNGRLRTYLDNFMGKQEHLKFEQSTGDILPGDLFFFCSDGFYHHFTEADAVQMYRDLLSGTAPDALCACAVQTMIARGERDNISVGVLYAASQETKPARFSLFGSNKYGV